MREYKTSISGSIKISIDEPTILGRKRDVLHFRSEFVT
jgi:hypothetical protein